MARRPQWCAARLACMAGNVSALFVFDSVKARLRINQRYFWTVLFQCCSIASGFGQISLKQTIPIGGINQYIQIKGAHAEDPVLLFLHGGPGNSVMGYADKFTDELQKHFVVVQWDQRESGKTAKPGLQRVHL